MDTSALLLVRATVHLPGLPVDVTARVDPSVPYIADCLEAAFLVPIGVATPAEDVARDA